MRLAIILTLVHGLSLFIGEPKYAEFPPTRGPQTVLVLRIIDGDTIEAAYLVPVRIRLHGTNAPELNSLTGKDSARALATFLPPGELAEADLKGREKYGRQLADFTHKDGKVSSLMIGGGHAKPWDGKGEKP